MVEAHTRSPPVPHEGSSAPREETFWMEEERSYGYCVCKFWMEEERSYGYCVCKFWMEEERSYGYCVCKFWMEEERSYGYCVYLEEKNSSQSNQKFFAFLDNSATRVRERTQRSATEDMSDVAFTMAIGQQLAVGQTNLDSMTPNMIRSHELYRRHLGNLMPGSGGLQAQREAGQLAQLPCLCYSTGRIFRETSLLGYVDTRSWADAQLMVSAAGKDEEKDGCLMEILKGVLSGKHERAEVIDLKTVENSGPNRSMQLFLARAAPFELSKEKEFHHRELLVRMSGWGTDSQTSLALPWNLILVGPSGGSNVNIRDLIYTVSYLQNLVPLETSYRGWRFHDQGVRARSRSGREHPCLASSLHPPGSCVIRFPQAAGHIVFLCLAYTGFSVGSFQDLGPSVFMIFLAVPTSD
ncbi:hypothetical protein RRG08_009661 [Elysia crispata]|uniref:Uncharacterized protein n=1 Tax=Elysia crispata TaxID=231223 RepID=A0AAE0ZVB9_9GAST|nr:hypothetical protein RRG08_009661 [Elysia crispata]